MKKKLSHGDDFEHNKLISFHFKGYLVGCKRNNITARGVAMVGRTGVAGQDFDQRLTQGLGQKGEERLGAFYPDLMAGKGVDKAAADLGMAVGKGNVGLDVEDGRAVHEVGPLDMEHGSVGGMEVDGEESYGRESERIGTEGRPGGPHTYSLVASQARGTYGRRPLLAHILGELPDEPQVVEPLDASQGLGIAVFGFKDDGGRQLFYHITLSWNTELGGKERADVSDRTDLRVHTSKDY